jgi:HEAT repeat protein
VPASQVAAELNTDPEWVARREAKDQARLARVKANRIAAAPVLKELAEAGYRSSSLADLRGGDSSYISAVPILIKWLEKSSNREVKQDIARALSFKWARPEATSALIREFRLANDDDTGLGLRWTIANALAEVADDGVFNEIVELVTDSRYGRAREMLAIALGNMTDRRAIGVLIKLLGDDEVAGHAVIALGRQRAKAAEGHIEPFTHHAKAWIRREAKKSLARIKQAS